MNLVLFAEKPVAALLLNADILVGNVARQDREKRAFSPLLEIWSKNQKFLENWS